MSGPTFLSLVRGNRVEGFLGLKLDPGVAYRFAQNYSYAELNLLDVLDAAGEKLNGDKIVRNQSATLRAGATIAPSHGHQALLVPNPIIFQYASAPSMLLLDTGDRRPVDLTIRTFRDLPLGELEWFMRLYLIA